MKTSLTLLSFLLSFTMAAQSSGLSLTLAQGLTQSNGNVHLASDLSLAYSHPLKNSWSFTVAGIFAKSVVETGLRFPSDQCTRLFVSCPQPSINFVSRESRAGLSIGFNKHWDKLSFGFFLRGMTRLNDRLDVITEEENASIINLGTATISAQYGETLSSPSNAADLGNFIPLSEKFRLQPGLMVDYALNKTISIGLISRLDILSPNRVELQNIGGFRFNSRTPETIFEGQSRAYYFQGGLRCFIW
jgi:hypothetical protein